MSAPKINTSSISKLPDELYADSGITELYANAFDLDDYIELSSENLQDFDINEHLVLKLAELNFETDRQLIIQIIKETTPRICQHFKSRGLTELSSKIKNLTNLEVLDLSNNRLETIPVEIGNLKNLKMLKLANNNIKRIPFAIKKLIHLECLDLSDNPITKIPDVLSKLGKLQIAEKFRASKQNQIFKYLANEKSDEIGNLTDLIKNKGIYFGMQKSLVYHLKDDERLCVPMRIKFPSSFYNINTPFGSG